MGRYSKLNGYEAAHFADAVCACGRTSFALKLDDSEGVAVRVCPQCAGEHPIGYSVEYLADAELEERACVFGAERFQITVGVALYADGDSVRWLYPGCRCPACNLTAVYGDWKNEHESYEELLGRV